MTKPITYYQDEDVLTKFYEAIANRDERVLTRIHIPRSDVFYVREALKIALGEVFTLDRVERAMYLEGMLKARDCFEPDRKREWE
jgi:hypothetical protein